MLMTAEFVSGERGIPTTRYYEPSSQQHDPRLTTLTDLTQEEIEASPCCGRSWCSPGPTPPCTSPARSCRCTGERRRLPCCAQSRVVAALWIVAVIVFFVQPLAGVVLFVIAFFPLVGGGVGLVVVQARISRENCRGAGACGAVKESG